MVRLGIGSRIRDVGVQLLRDSKGYEILYAFAFVIDLAIRRPFHFPCQNISEILCSQHSIEALDNSESKV